MLLKNLQICWRGFIHDSQGYSRASREYILALDRLGVDVKIEPLNLGTRAISLSITQTEKLQELINKPIANDKDLILIYHSQPYGINPDEERKKGFKKVIINTVWETDKVPDNWFPNINKADAVFVPSKQNIEALRNSGVSVPIFLVPHGANTEVFKPDNTPLPLKDIEGKFTFVSVFQWQHRKSPDILLKAYWNEFNKDDNIALVIKTYWSNNPSKADQRGIVNHIAKYKSSLGFSGNTAPLYLTFNILSDEQLKGIYTMADVFVLPSRGEGVGLPYIEALSSGIPVIATGWGGQVDFLNEGNSYAINYSLESTFSNIENGIAPNFSNLFTEEMNWAEPSIDSLRDKMRLAYSNPHETRQKGVQGRKDMINMSWDKAGEQIKEGIELIIHGN